MTIALGAQLCDSVAVQFNFDKIYFHLEGDITVQSVMQLPANSDLDGELTLACISTGGPATNVTWTRDSEEVAGGITVLNDATKAQYTHILTLNEGQGGLYKCTVSNNKPSHDSASIQVEGTVRIYHCILCFIIHTIECLHT